MPHTLRIHPGSLCPAVTSIEADVARPRAGSLVLSYVVTGAIAGLRVPPVAAPSRADELWRHTCFEAFIRATGGSAYYEFNLSPSTQWAAYRFDDYRTGMHAASEARVVEIDVPSGPERLALRAELELGRPPELSGTAVWHLGLSAVIEDVDGRISYWALTHPEGRPDFHHPDCFALKFPQA